ncbi:Nuclear pore complex protein Nup88 [Nymphon striatum]|nr:Nuclear pore complex protein Nup88 [Nymphon striatum]KAG1711223.1 Nuclear pore complex protein Nup88 [Nymphon striatum]
MNISLSLGEVAISFDFGPSIDSTSNKIFIKKDDEIEKYWPAFVLHGNGDVYSLLLHTPAIKRFQKPTIQGPFLMYPAADDNYGVDSCSILCLKSNPLILVVATCSGAIYHSIVLESNPQADESYVSQVVSRNNENKINWSLYVIESIELELSLKTFEYNEDIMCPIHLHHDPTTYMRYHCSHSAGIHTMALPFIHHLEQFVEKEDLSSMPNILEKECVVEHLLCTKPLPSSPDSPVLGVSIMVSHQLGLTLMCLTSQLKPICLPLTNIFHKQPSSTFEDMSKFAKNSSPINSNFKESFKDHVVKILQRSSSNPLIRSNPNSKPSSEECLQLLTRATQVFRVEYISRLDAAREEIEKRVRVLSTQKDQQFADMQANGKEQDTLKVNMERLNSKYKKVWDKQIDLTNRAQKLMMNVQRSTVVLSDAEKNLLKDYEDMSKKLKDYENLLEKVKVTRNYQESLPKYDERKSSLLSPPSLNDTQQKYLRETIIQESEEMNESKKIIAALKKELSI